MEGSCVTDGCFPRGSSSKSLELREQTARSLRESLSFTSEHLLKKEHEMFTISERSSTLPGNRIMNSARVYYLSLRKKSFITYPIIQFFEFMFCQ